MNCMDSSTVLHNVITAMSRCKGPRVFRLVRHTQLIIIRAQNHAWAERRRKLRQVRIRRSPSYSVLRGAAGAGRTTITQFRSICHGQPSGQPHRLRCTIGLSVLRGRRVARRNSLGGGGDSRCVVRRWFTSTVLLWTTVILWAVTMSF